MNLPQGTNVADITRLFATKCKLISTESINNNQDQGGDNDEWATQHLEFPPDGGLCFISAVQDHKGQTSGDGPYKNGQSTGGYFSFEEGSINSGENYSFTGANEVPVHPSENLPYCGKIGGVDGAVSTTNLLSKLFDITKGTVTHDIDNAAVLNIFLDQMNRTQLHHASISSKGCGEK